MKKIFLLFMFSISLISCSNDDNNESTSENTIIGRWHLVGFEETVLYEFTNDLRYTIYSDNGNFGNLNDAIPNPNTWSYEGDNLVIDLNFGNFLIATPKFKCNGNVLDLVSENGTSILFKEGYDFNDCND